MLVTHDLLVGQHRSSAKVDSMDTLMIMRMSAVDLVRAIRMGEISAQDAVDASLSTIEKCDHDLHSFITIAADSARKSAQKLDDIQAGGGALGPLHGVPVAVKDLTLTAGIRTTFGSARHAQHVPVDDDLVVSRLKVAGAIIIGKTNTPEYGFGALCKSAPGGNTVNPYDARRSSGGSSGGSAVAVATGMTPLAHGTDFGGSVRTPASFCNIVGFRPGAGRIPRVPKGMPWETLMSHGVLARSVEDAALMASVLSGGDERDPASLFAPAISAELSDSTSRQDIRIKISPDLGCLEIDTDVANVFDIAVSALRPYFPNIEQGCPNFEGAIGAFEVIRAAMLFHHLGPLLDSHENPLSETVRWNVARGRNLTAEELIQAETMRGKIIARCVAFFKDTDVLIIPSASVLPFPLDQENVDQINGQKMSSIIDYLAVTFFISLSGLPCISIPAGFSDGGLPVGIQLVAGPGRDNNLIRIAALVSDLCGFKHAFPN
tara:strand:- start:4523 stop:5992 length:1470 start_codon:yes stop_codon:yes gene_type:complete